MLLPMLDWISLIVFVTIYFVYSWLVESSPWAKQTLSRSMARERKAWFEVCLSREVRIFDSQIMGLQQNGAAYFGSACLLGIGAGFTLLSTSDGLAQALVNFPVLGQPTAGELQIKSLVLMLVFALGFFQFSWAFRLFGYNAIVLGAITEEVAREQEKARTAAHRAAAFNIQAGQHFNQAMRLFFFAIPLIFWIISAYALLVATVLLVIIMMRRQFLTVAQLDGLALAWDIEEQSPLEKSSEDR